MLANPEAAADAIVPVQVHFRDRVLFEIAAPLGALSPAERAQAVERRLLAIAGGPATVLSALRVEERSDLSELYAGDTLIRAITERDALPTGRTRRQLAADQLLVIRQALQVEFKDRGAAHVARALGMSIGATVLLLGLLIGLRWLYRWIHARINRAAQAWHWSSGLARLKLLSPRTVANTSRSIATFLAFIVGLLLVYFYLEFVLSQFPWTRGLADQMVAAAKGAVVHVFSGLFDYVPSLLNIFLIVFVARYILKALRGFFEQIATGNLTFAGFHPSWGLPTYSIVRFFVIAIAAVMVFPYLPGSGSAGFKGVSTFVGLSISFGGAPAIGNMIAGVIITYMRPFAVGDRVKIADAVGDVIGKNLLVVRLRTIKNVEISIPNALVLANHIINFSANAKEQGLILHTTVTIGYDAPWKKVHELLIRAAQRVEGILAEPAPFVLQTSLDDFYVTYEINAYTDRPNDQALLYSQLHTEIQNAFNEGGVEILSPHYAAVRDGNAMAVPSDYLPKDYKAPGFTLLSRILRPGHGST
jgi:small-conductance mechanosensitive channel